VLRKYVLVTARVLRIADGETCLMLQIGDASCNIWARDSRNLVKGVSDGLRLDL
jgi:hypothetical protein